MQRRVDFEIIKQCAVLYNNVQLYYWWKSLMRFPVFLLDNLSDFYV